MPRNGAFATASSHKTAAFADAGYTSADKREPRKTPRWEIARRRGEVQKLQGRERQRIERQEHEKASVRVKALARAKANAPPLAVQAAVRKRTLASLMSRAGDMPNMRPYSRVNCGTLS